MSSLYFPFLGGMCRYSTKKTSFTVTLLPKHAHSNLNKLTHTHTDPDNDDLGLFFKELRRLFAANMDSKINLKKQSCLCKAD
jgi:hypothetical protein